MNQVTMKTEFEKETLLIFIGYSNDASNGQFRQINNNYTERSFYE
jgi:hypothetical protein